MVVLSLCMVIFMPPNVQATGEDGAALVQQHRCYGCHALTENLLGPSYQAISTRHAARKDVMVEILTSKIIVGGAGNWGVVPMVPSEHVSLDEARIMARWILNLETKISKRR
jgi:cytochrome c